MVGLVMMNVHMLAARRIEIEDAYTTHLEHDIDPEMALRALSPLDAGDCRL